MRKKSKFSSFYAVDRLNIRTFPHIPIHCAMWIDIQVRSHLTRNKTYPFFKYLSAQYLTGLEPPHVEVFVSFWMKLCEGERKEFDRLLDPNLSLMSV